MKTKEANGIFRFFGAKKGNVLEGAGALIWYLRWLYEYNEKKKQEYPDCTKKEIRTREGSEEKRIAISPSC